MARCFSSFESMSATLAPAHWGVHGGAPPAVCNHKTCEGPNVMAQRNYANDNFIVRLRDPSDFY